MQAGEAVTRREVDPARALERDPGKPGAVPALRPEPQDPDLHGERALLCARCSAQITREGERIAVGGRHEHTRLNPGGVLFQFGCFRAAEGCEVYAEPTFDDSWFAGCAWQFAACRQCGAHLGWYFSGADSFFGLILDRLSAG